MSAPEPTDARSTLVREQPWILVIIGVGIMAASVANRGGVVLGLVGFLIAAAGTSLWVAKLVREDRDGAASGGDGSED